MSAATSARWLGVLGLVQRLPQLGVLPPPVTVTANRDQVAVMDETIDERGGHDVIAEDVAPLFKALIGREHGGRALITARHELKEEHRARTADGQIADLVDDQEGGMRPHLQPRLQPAPYPPHFTLPIS